MAKDPTEILKNNHALRASGAYKTKFKNASGQYLVRGLFEGPQKVYTYDELGDLYIEHEDLLEYDFATKYLDGWQHWLRLCDSPLVSTHISRWREELDLKIRCRALQAIKEEAEDPLNRGYVQANRYLLEKGHLKVEGGKSTGQGRGRPKKIEEVDNSFDISRIREDSARILIPKKEMN